MSKKTPGSLLPLAALAGGIGFVVFAALMALGGGVISPVIFLAILAALAAVAYLVLRAREKDRAETPRRPDAAMGGSAGHATARSRIPAAGGSRSGDTSTASPDKPGMPIEAADAPARAEASPPPTDLPPASGSSRTDAAPPKWKSTQLTGSTELSTRKGSWKYERPGSATGGAATPPPIDTTTPPPADTTAPAALDPATNYGAGTGPAIGTEPPRLDAPREGGADDLQRISGVGPKLEGQLHRLGIYHFDQIAGWSAAEIVWVDEHLEGFKGRVTRDEWVRQARDITTPPGPPE